MRHLSENGKSSKNAELSFCANELIRDAEVKLLSCISSIAGLNPTEGLRKAELNFKNPVSLSLVQGALVSLSRV